jgi:hypothetical protein
MARELRPRTVQEITISSETHRSAELRPRVVQWEAAPAELGYGWRSEDGRRAARGSRHPSEMTNEARCVE